ncbi:M81 family metallopeptidase [Bradyrhizobium betae]
MSQTRRVLSAQIAHETNTFSIVPTTLEDYRKAAVSAGRRDRRGAGRHQDGDRRASGRSQALTAGPWCSRSPPRRPHPGKVTAECWAELQRLVYAGLPKPGPFDGVILALHGAMVTETDDDAEGALLEGLRKRLGETIPIAVTLDLHANVTERMGRLASIMLPYRTYPHIDQYETAFRAAELLQAAMDGTTRPKVFRLQGASARRMQSRPDPGRRDERPPGARRGDAGANARPAVRRCLRGLQPLGHRRESAPASRSPIDASHNAAEAAARGRPRPRSNDEMVRRRAEVTVTALDLPDATKASPPQPRRMAPTPVPS